MVTRKSLYLPGKREVERRYSGKERRREDTEVKRGGEKIQR